MQHCSGTRGVNDVGGANVTQAILRGVNMRVAGNDVFMPAFGEAYPTRRVSALANYVIAHFGGKQGTVTPDGGGQRRSLRRWCTELGHAREACV